LKLPGVSIVVIGFNEEQNLHDTFMAIQKINYPSDLVEIIYVDSGSTDRSVEIAKLYTDKVFLEIKFPSPGRNRNRGLLEAKYDIVHFIDGDLTIDPDYLKVAVPLFQEKNVQAVMGQLEEQEPNLLNRIAALENSKKVEGYSHFTATGATYLKEAILRINGYDERIRRGEETELGERFMAKGNRIWCTLQKMGSHNFEINSPFDFAKRYRNDATSQVQSAFMKGDSQHFINLKKRYKKAIVKFLIFLVVLAVSIALQSIWIFLAYTILTTLNRNKAIFKRYFKDYPNLVMIRTLIDYFLIVFWWYGFFKESFNYHFKNGPSSVYQLPKQILEGK
jgi:glycosyltransferase involved in cell wall biosynthesis